MSTQIKPVVSLNSIAENSVSSVISEAAKAMKSEGQVEKLNEMVERCMASNDFQESLEIIKDYVVLVR